MKKIINLSLFFLIMLSMSSCLKDKLYNDRVIGHNINNQTYLEMQEANKATKNTVYAFEIADKDTIIQLIPIRIASGESPVATEDITITLDTSYTSEYISENIEDNGSLRNFTSAIGSLASGLTVTIPKGSSEAYIAVKINTSKFNPSYQYVLGYKMVSSSSSKYPLSGLLDRHAFVFSAKNKYDGVYKLSGYHNRVPFTFPYTDVEVYLVTLTGNSVAVFWPEPGIDNYGHPIGVGPDNDLSWYGTGISPAFTFDLNTNNVTNAYNFLGTTVISLYTSATGPGALANKYDPATKTLEVSWMYANNPLRGFFDTFVYVGKRP